MNRLLALLRLEDNLTPGRLKQLYRRLSKKTHPDLAPGAHEDFVRLRGDYEEALGLLGDGLPGATACPVAAVRPGARREGSGREAVLRLLYQYSVRFYGRDSAGILSSLQRAARSYSPALHALLAAYRECFLERFSAWAADGRIYYAHNLFIASVKQLIYWHSLGILRHRTLLRAYLQELRARARRIAPDKARILLRLADWLQEESEKAGIRVL